MLDRETVRENIRTLDHAPLIPLDGSRVIVLSQTQAQAIADALWDTLAHITTEGGALWDGE